MKDGKIAAFATWVAYEDRITTISQKATTPYAAAVALTPAAKAEAGELRTELEASVRPWRASGKLILSVEMQLHFVAHLNRYRSADLFEERPTNGGIAFGGDYKGIEQGEGWRFNLAHDPEDASQGFIEVRPATIIIKD